MQFPESVSTTVEETIRDALRELRQAGGIRYLDFPHGPQVAHVLVATGLARLDDGPMHQASLRITMAGRWLLLG